MKYPFLVLKDVNAPYEKALIEAATKVIKSGWYINGKHVGELERQIADLCNTPYAVAVSNGLDALKLIVRAYKELGIFHDNDEIIMSANTYVATALAVSDEGLRPVFVDMSPETLNLDTSLISNAISDRTVAIMPVHLYGTPCWDNNITDIAKQFNLKIIEDNAQAIGASSNIPGLYGTFKTGGLGDAAGISFYPTKNLGALGDAGMVTTHDKDIADTVRALANYGTDRRYHNIYKGNNCRMDEIQAAMLLAKLQFLGKENERRNELVATYNKNITNPLVTKPIAFHGMLQVWHQYPLRITQRKDFIKYMEENGVATDIIYPSPVYMQPCYEQDYKLCSCKEAEKFAEEVICLPIGSHISLNDAIEIAQIINRYNA